MTHEVHGIPRFSGPLLASLALHLVLLVALTGVRWSLPQVPKGAPESKALPKDPLTAVVQVDLSALPLPGIGKATDAARAPRQPAAPATNKSIPVLPALVAPGNAKPAAAIRRDLPVTVPAAAPVAATSQKPAPAAKLEHPAPAETVPTVVTMRVDPQGAGKPQRAAAGAAGAAGAGGVGADGVVSKAVGGEGAKAGAAGAGRTGAGAARRGSYQGQVKALIEAHKKYPVAARKLGREGRCERRLVLARDGSLKQVETVSSCGHPFLDAAATRAITDVGKFPPLPDEFGAPQESFTVTMSFSLSDSR
ncbi:hypothetical protein GMST_16270 [Geomonas silvestris]|uniref:TonB C-terminal domain-containing protein n=1 Tax=Geomonas silvestris TaxID=2740184 RepID=A0A6V8MH64_9BACT|nr:energy transducer TonB [Geomonas silvestris]GFO59302.1 hypothetical protein GMST_16270 [Geomonas silvestris]